MNQKKQIIILAVLGVVAVGVVIFQMLRKEPAPPTAQGTNKAAATKTAAAGKTASSKTAQGKTPAAGAAKQTGEEVQIKKADVNIDELLAGIKEVDFDYEQNRLPRDPMAPLVGRLPGKKEEGTEEQSVAPASAVQVMNKVVSGILWDKHRPLAVVDNEVVYPGYVYADGTVVESIERDRVTFKVGDSLIQNPLKEF